MRLRTYIVLAVLLYGFTAASGQAASDASQVTTPDARPLPELATLMAAAQRRQKNDEAIERNYMYRMTITMELTDKDGKPKHTITNVDDVYWTEGVKVFRPIERNGKALTPEAQAKEEARFKKAMKERQAKAEKDKPDEEIRLSRLLELGSFTAPHREMVNNRPTIAVDFVGDPKAKTRTDQEKIMHYVAGTVWIDEADHTVQHVQGQLINDFRLGAGLLANIGKGTTFSYSKVRVNDELWLPDVQDMRGHFRFLLLLAGNTHMRIHSTDFRKLKVSSTILPGVNEVSDAVSDTTPAPPVVRQNP